MSYYVILGGPGLANGQLVIDDILKNFNSSSAYHLSRMQLNSMRALLLADSILFCIDFFIILICRLRVTILQKYLDATCKLSGCSQDGHRR